VPVSDPSMPDRRAAVIGRRVLLSGLLAAASARAWAADPPSARAFVDGIYRAYRSPSEMSATGVGIALDSAGQVRRYFAPDLAALIIADKSSAAKKGDEPALDGDPFIDAQDWGLTNLRIDVRDVDRAHAAATVTFANFGKPATVRLDLVLVKGGWRIDDIHWAEGTLRGLYAPTAK